MPNLQVLALIVVVPFVTPARSGSKSGKKTMEETSDALMPLIT